VEGETRAIFFITTARSGTQWIHHVLDRLYGDSLVSEHEPIGYDYEPRRSLRNAEALREIRRRPSVDHHMAGIHQVLKTKNYVEVGFPSCAAAPMLIKEFGPKLKLVQLTRHPAKVAASLVTHQWFGRRRPEIASLVTPHPSDLGVGWPQFTNRWDDMSRFERGLYYWGEVHLYGREVEMTYPETPFCRIRFEDLVSDPAQQARLHEFMVDGPMPDWRAVADERIDSYHRKTLHAIKPSTAYRHPEIVTLAQEFGYSFDETPRSLLRERYVASSPRQIFAYGLAKAVRASVRVARHVTARRRNRAGN